MKSIRYFLVAGALAMTLAWSCKQEAPMLFEDVNRISFADTATLNYTFYYDDASVDTGTAYVEVNTMGFVTDYDRLVVLEQIPEYDITYVRDENNVIVDTLETPVSNPALSGVHFVPFSEMADEWIVPAGANTAKLPIKLLRDASLRNGEVRLRVAIRANLNFEIMGGKTGSEKTVVFADALLKPAWWDNPNFRLMWGAWSARKMEFMAEVMDVKIDQQWFDTIMAGSAMANYVRMMQRALADYVAENGPMLDENGQSVTF